MKRMCLFNLGDVGKRGDKILWNIYEEVIVLVWGKQEDILN